MKNLLKEDKINNRIKVLNDHLKSDNKNHLITLYDLLLSINNL